MAVSTNGTGSPATTATESLDNIKPPPGIIIPPPGEIREAIEKTAGYVMRGGSGLEQRIRDNHSRNPKFSFLMTSSDPYNAYYEWRKSEIKAGRGTAIAAGRANDPLAAAAAPAPEVPKGPPKPPDFHFSARMPRMSSKDLDIVRLTALFVAKNGRSFLTQLSQREASNAQYQFLLPNHTFHNFFENMVDQYTLLLRETAANGAAAADGANANGSAASSSLVQQLRENIKDKFQVLARAKLRTEYDAWQEKEREKQEEEDFKKKLEFARIDWNDFIVVETIVLDEADDDVDLPPPTTLNDLQYASLEEKNKFSISSSLRIEEAFPFEDTSYNAFPVKPAGPEIDDQKAREAEQERLRVQQAQAEARSSVLPMKIKENYVPRAGQRPANKGTQTALCPNCKQQIPLSEMEEHMRIELLDPRWKEQKAKADARFATTNLSTADVANNLKRLASQRADIFDGVTGQPISEEEQARRKKIALNSFDGNLDTKNQAHVAQLQSYNLDEQIRAIHQKFADKK